MKTLRKKLKSISFIMSFLILFASCNQYDDSIQNDNISSKNITGKQLFKTIFFGTEDVVLNIKHLDKFKVIRSSLKIEELSQLDNYAELIANNLEINNEGFFIEFKNNLYSKNHYTIQTTLEKTAGLIEKAILKIPEIRDAYLFASDLTKKIDVSKYINEDGIFDEDGFIKALELEYGDKIENIITPTVLGVWIAIALVQTVVVAVSYWIGVFVTIETPWTKTAGKTMNMSKLQSDILINDLYENLQ